MLKITKEDVFSIENRLDFEEIALSVFKYQAQNVPVYKQFIDYLGIDIHQLESLEDIPFLPIDFFKTQHVADFDSSEEFTTFTSSGTTGPAQSNHLVKDLSWYEESFLKGFEYFYGPIEDYILIALLPSYLEREGSSLIYMCNELIKKSNDNKSGFYLNEFEKIKTIIEENDGNKNVLLIGVTYALLDFAEQLPFEMSNCIMMETGGMKGKRKEMLREEVHKILMESFKLNNIHSEYGMTELLSQAYSKGKGIFRTPPWMKILIRETHDPFSYHSFEKTGGINVIDLANIHSCSFIATQDLGKLYPDERFEVLGRFDAADIRGCNLLVQ